MPMRPIELRDPNNATVYSTQIDVGTTFPEIVKWGGKPFLLKSLMRTTGLGLYRETTILDLDVPEGGIGG